MMKLVILSFLALELWPGGANDRVHYYLNENDFLSNRAVPASETIHKTHIKTEYDSLDRLISKSMIDSAGLVEKYEKYSYRDLSQNIALKLYFNNRHELIKTTLFGDEPRSLAYIEYVFGVDSVKKWDDRFTTSILNKDEKPENFRFFDVNAFEYGGMEFDYDSSGNKTREEWFRKPDNKSMHKYLFKLYPGLDYTHILEYDSNGVLINDLKLSSDGTEAILWFTSPLDSAYINSSEINYRLEGNLDWGRFIWAPDSGLDSLILDLTALSRGDHRIAFESDSNLSDSLKYDVIFSGWTKNGNKASERRREQLTFDVSPPLMTLNIHPYLNSPEIEFITSEGLKQGFLIWDLVSRPFGLKGDTVNFLASELLKSSSEKFILQNQSGLRDSAYYSVKLIGIDFAGNQSVPAQVDSILYDITGPRLVIAGLASGDWINHQKFIFSTDETIKNWNLSVEWTGGAEDIAAPYKIEFADTILKSISDTSDLFTEFQLNDGSIYAYKLQGIDLAGNISKISRVDSIHYDISSPEITMIYPFDGAVINNVSVSYAVSESLLAGEFRWEHTGGTLDTLAPHIVELINQELQAREKIHINLQNEPEVMDGAYYTITVSGKDLAGNESELVVVKNVLFDSRPPMFSNLGPQSGSAVKNTDISYQISEDLKTGSIIWVPREGEVDPQAAHFQKLDKDELVQGEHFNLEIINSPNLQDGTVYDIIFVGSDFAGNTADTVRLENILYDFTAPEIILNYPRANFVSPTEKISYSLSENLQKGSFHWKWTGGNADSAAPHILYLNTAELELGEHMDIQFLEFPPLVENAQYTLIFTGEDPAGNAAQSQVSITNLSYDFTPPVVTWNYPLDNGAENVKKVGYKISEPLASGHITWKWTGGVKDSLAIRIAELTGDELEFDRPVEKLINNPDLVDGAIYDLVFSGFDFAGNKSDMVEIQHVLYDFTPPELSISYPKPRSMSKSNLMTYTLSEDLYEGIFKWIWLGGSEDTLAPHVVHLNKIESKSGEHVEQILEDAPELVDNSLYTLIVTGQDIAGNKLRSTILPGLQYDYSPPVFTWTSPRDGTAQNHQRVQYGISELLDSGYLTWIRVGGALDPNQKHRLELSGEELTGREHGEKALVSEANLVTGAVYDIKLTGTDLAGNITDTLIARNVEYDIQAPQLSIEYPVSNIYTTATNILYSLDENIIEGEFIWENISPNRNIPPITYQLSPEASLAGQHSSDDYYIPDLIDGSVYTISFSAGDKAGNISKPLKITNYRVDRTPPVFSDFQPSAGAFINNLDLGWNLSEDIEEGSIIVENINSGNVVSVTLTKNDLQGGSRALKALPGLILADGESYNLSLQGKDFAGNNADTVKIENITYDISAPQISITNPLSGQHLNISDITYTTAEILAEAEVIWVRTKGQNEFFRLNEKDLTAGSHILTDYWEEPAENDPFSIFITGVDRAGNTANSDTIENLLFDNTKPELTLLSPLDESAINHSRLNLKISEDLSTARVSWEAVAGIDREAPYIINLIEDELKGGERSEMTFSKIPALKDGVTYKLTFEGTDLAGNEALPVQKNNILFDITPPAFTELNPEDNAFINEVNLSYFLSENLREGAVIFEIVVENGQPGPSQTVKLAGKRKEMGQGGGLLPASIIQLTSGEIYNIKFTGSDRAGNAAEERVISNITFDNEKPVLDLIEPNNGSFVRSSSLSYFISEELAEAEFILEQAAESEQIIATIKLSKAEMAPGDHLNVFLKGMVGWEDGGMYNLTLKGQDQAGNTSEPAVVKAVTLDQTNPVISLDKPVKNSYINYETLSYTLSEQLREGTIVFTQLSENTANQPVQNIELIGSELKQGSKQDIKLAQGPNLVNGQSYRIEMNGSDRAGNRAETVIVEQVKFDNEAPEISLSMPIDGEQIQNTNISYIVSDDLSQAEAVLVQTGGTRDPLSPHRVKLTGAQLTMGMHADVELNLEDKLADGGRYSFTIEGTDRALNSAKTSIINDVLFDILPPQIDLVYPRSGVHLNEITLSFGTSEEMSTGDLIFTRMDGNDDFNSPHKINLTGDQLKQGDHENINLNLILEDGSFYKMQFVAVDLAGNIADTITVSNIFYDITAPVITVINPAADSFHKTINLAITNNEDLIAGELIVERRAGTADGGSPHSINFTGEQLLAQGEINFALNEELSLVSGTIYNIKINGTDLAGNQSSELEITNITLDNTEPVLSFITPLSDSYVNHYFSEIQGNEKLAAATITWQWTGGAPDPAGKHEFSLKGADFRNGNYSIKNLVNPPALINGASYNISISGFDLAGNQSKAASVLIHYDNEKPAIADFSPATGEFINNLEINYTLTEILENGFLQWERADKTIKIELTGSELTSPGLERAVLTNQTDLADGFSYNLIFHGIDRAGNVTDSTLSENVTYDIWKPKFTNVKPSTGNRINSPLISWEVNENLASGSYTWIYMGGKEDPNAPHKILFDDPLHVAGKHDNSGLKSPPLVADAMYRITLEGTDPAGNTGKKLMMSIVYDDLPPALNIDYPPPNSAVANVNIAYRISERLSSGQIIYTRIAGEPDPNSPVIVELTGAELEKNYETPEKPVNAPVLKDGAIYSISFKGLDLALNVSESPSIDSVKYDITKPIITITNPQQNQNFMGTEMTIDISEDLQEGKMVWTRTGGVPDRVTMHKIPFYDIYLKQGFYPEANLPMEKTLSAGVIYSLSVDAQDFAGNQAEPVNIEGIKYIRSMAGRWYYKGAIIEVIWKFNPDPGKNSLTGDFMQGLSLGTKISDQETGRYTLDFDSKIWTITLDMDNPQKSRFSIFEFKDNTHIKVITGVKPPKNWFDGEVMDYEWRPD